MALAASCKRVVQTGTSAAVHRIPIIHHASSSTSSPRSWMSGSVKPNDMDQHFSSIQHEIEKLRDDLEKMPSNLRPVPEEQASHRAETVDLLNKYEKDIHALKAQVQAAEATKDNVLKCCIGALVSASAVGLAICFWIYTRFGNQVYRYAWTLVIEITKGSQNIAVYIGFGGTRIRPILFSEFGPVLTFLALESSISARHR